MAVKVNGGPLEFDAIINNGGFQGQIDSIEKRLIGFVKNQAEQQKIANQAQKEYASLITSSGAAFSKLDSGVQNQIRALTSYRTALAQVKDAQSTLEDRFKNGVIGASTYNGSMSALVVKENELSAAINKATTSIQAQEALLRAGSGSINQKTIQLNQLKEAYRSLSDADRGNAAIGGKMLSNIQALDKEVNKLNADFIAIAQNAAGSLNQKIAQVARLKAEYAALSEIDRKNGNIGGNLRSNIQGLDQEIEKINGSFNTTGNLAQEAAQAIAAYATFSAGTNFIKDVVRVRGEFQQLEVAFNTMLGSKEKADKLLAQAVDLAAKTPFTLQEVGSGAKQLLAYGFAAEDITDNLKKLGNIAAGVGAPLNDLIYLYGTLRTQGKALGKDIREFTGRGVNLVPELAKQFGVAQDEVEGLVTAGKIGFPEVEAAINSLTQSGGMFFNLMEAQSKTLTGLTSNLSDAWSRMLNEIGKSNEGLFTDAIKGAISLVDNYKEVIKIIELIAITYGTYRAAIIATNAAMLISSGIQNGLTLSQSLYQAAVVISDRVTKLFNITLLANPAALVVSGIVALGTALILFSGQVSRAERAQKTLNEVTAEANKTIDVEKDKLGQLLAIAKDETRSKEDRLAALKKIIALAPENLNNLTLENIKTKESAAAIDEYIKALERKAKAQAASSAIEKLYSERQDIILNGQKGENTSLIDDIKKGALAASGAMGLAISQSIKDNKKRTEEAVKDKEAEIEAVKNFYKADLEGAITNDAKKGSLKNRTVDIIDEEIKVLKTRQAAESQNHAQFVKFQDEINKLEAERLRITGASKKAAEAAENKALSLLEKRKSLLEEIASLERGSKQSGLIKEQSELDKINEKYETAKSNIDEYNKKVASFNSKNPGAKVAGIGLADINALNTAQKNEIRNAGLKEDAANYKKSLDAQQAIFSQYEEAKKEIGVGKAREMYQDQTKGFGTYIQYLEAEAAKIFPKVFGGNADIADQQKLIDINKELIDAKAKQRELDFTKAQEDFKRVYDSTITYNERQLQLEREFQADLVVIRNEFKGDDATEREAIRRDQYKQEQTELKNNLLRQSELYRKLNTDIIGFTRAQIRDHIKELEKIKSNGFFKDKSGKSVLLTPEMLADLDSAIDSLDEMEKSSRKSVIAFTDLSEQTAKVQGSLNALSSALGFINSDLADSVKQAGEFANILGQAADAGIKFASGDLAGGIQGAIGAVSGIVQQFANARASRNAANAEVFAFGQRIINSELELNAIYRERDRIQAGLNKSKLDAIKAESAELTKQQVQVKKDTQAVMDLIAKETYTISESEKKKGLGSVAGLLPGIFGPAIALFGRGSKVEKEQASLTGKTFDDLQKLFASGQLSDRAKELFTQLEKLKKEGADIDALLAENTAKAREIFTGTTADNIVSSLRDGFANGFKSVEEFAGKTEDIIRGAMLSALSTQALEGPIKALYEQFAKDAESGGGLDLQETENFTNSINSTIENALKFAEQLQKATGVSLSGATATANTNSLQGSIKASLTEDTGSLLAGQIGGLRLTSIAQLNKLTDVLNVINDIKYNTSFILSMDARLARIEMFGIKIKA